MSPHLNCAAPFLVAYTPTQPTHSTQENEQRVWKLTAPTSDAAASWCKTLRQAINNQSQSLPETANVNVENLFSEEAAMAERDIELLPGAWMTKKGEGVTLTGEKKRFFVLGFGPQSKMLKWVYYADVQDGVPQTKKGFIHVSQSSEVLTQDKHILVVGF